MIAQTVEAAHRSWKDVLAGHKFGSVSSVETLILHREDLAVLFRLYEHCKVSGLVHARLLLAFPVDDQPQTQCRASG